MTAQMVTVKPGTTVPEVGRGDERSMQRAVVGLGVRMIMRGHIAITREVPCELNTPVDAIEDAWAVVDPILGTHYHAHPCKPGGWGPRQPHALIAADGSWHNTILHITKVAQ